MNVMTYDYYLRDKTSENSPLYNEKDDPNHFRNSVCCVKICESHRPRD